MPQAQHTLSPAPLMATAVATGSGFSLVHGTPNTSSERPPPSMRLAQPSITAALPHESSAIKNHQDKCPQAREANTGTPPQEGGLLRHCRVLPFVVLIVVLTLAHVGMPCDVQAQTLIDLGRVARCRSCKLELAPLMRIGDARGDGSLDFSSPQLSYDPRTGNFAVFQIGRSGVSLFDSTGKVLRRVGGRGQGPGEVEQLVDVQFVGDALVMLDYPGRKLVMVDRAGKFVREVRLSLAPGRFRALADSLIVLGAMDRSPANVGWPLHLVNIFSGKESSRFGSSDGAYDGTRPFASDVVLGWTPLHTVPWHGKRRELRFERWTVDNRLLTRITGDMNWFLNGIVSSRDAPPPLFLAFGSDDTERLVVLTRVPDPRWRSVPRVGAEGGVESKYLDDFVDTRVDVFDLSGGRHLGTLILDDADPNLVSVAGHLILYRTEVGSDGVLRVVLYSVRPVVR